MGARAHVLYLTPQRRGTAHSEQGLERTAWSLPRALDGPVTELPPHPHVTDMNLHHAGSDIPGSLPQGLSRWAPGRTLILKKGILRLREELCTRYTARKWWVWNSNPGIVDLPISSPVFPILCIISFTHAPCKL